MTQDLDIDALAAELFLVFSRAEYALKAAGFHYGDGEAKADWSAFARQVDGLVASPPSRHLVEAINFILSAPPKKQMVSQGLLKWVDSVPSTNSQADALFQYVRRVRNNLFHGGKFNGGWFSPERSEPLLRHSLTILRAAIDAVPDVRDAYRG